MANWRTYQNSAANYLASAATNVATTITLSDATGFATPASGTEYTIRVDAEFMLVTGKTGNVLTVTRGANGTTAAAHTTGSIAFTCLCSGDLDAVMQQANLLVTSGVPSSPTFTTPQRMAFDPTAFKLYIWTGSAWKSVTLT